ncbi:MAG: hypothetical protein R3F11_31090 [Verrucomicrobiales bacterium]
MKSPPFSLPRFESALALIGCKPTNSGSGKCHRRFVHRYPLTA